MKPLLTLRATTNSIRNYIIQAQKIKNKGFWQECQDYSMRRGQSFQQMVLKKLDIHLQGMKLDAYLEPYKDINSK